MHDLDVPDDMDVEPLETTVYVHSPLIQCSTKGSYYTSYAVSLKSNNSCFTFPHSHLRRRYSEFVLLRNLLRSHYPTILTPALPPKNYFYRFNQVFIEERKIGLQHFLENVLNTPVYLSSKCVHLFLQSSCSMSEISDQVKGDVPAPRLLNSDNSMHSFHSDSSSVSSSESSEHRSNTKTKMSATAKWGERTKTRETAESLPIPILQKRKPKSHLSEVSQSLDSGNSSFESSQQIRRVSFNENVTVAVVCNQLWNYDIKPIKAGA